MLAAHVARYLGDMLATYDMNCFSTSLGMRRSAATCGPRLDALYFILYGLSREDAAYVLETFPIVRREDEAAFGSFRTRDLVLAYMNALAAGDTGTVVAV